MRLPDTFVGLVFNNKRFINGKMLTLWVVLYAIAMVGFVTLFPSDSSTPIPDLTFGYTPDELYSWIAQWSAEVRYTSVTGHIYDSTFYMLTYTVFFFIALCQSARVFASWPSVGGSEPGAMPSSEQARWAWLALFAFVPGFFDWQENFSLMAIVSNYPERMDGTVRYASFNTQAKWLMVVTAFILILTGGLVHLYKRSTGRTLTSSPSKAALVDNQAGGDATGSL